VAQPRPLIGTIALRRRERDDERSLSPTPGRMLVDLGRNVAEIRWRRPGMVLAARLPPRSCPQAHGRSEAETW
jgi:hypothetical protein